MNQIFFSESEIIIVNNVYLLFKIIDPGGQNNTYGATIFNSLYNSQYTWLKCELTESFQ